MKVIAAILVAIAIALAGASWAPAAGGLPPVAGAPDYQLGTAYPPVQDVHIVARDRTSAPARGTYSICYLNAFQSQPGERSGWPDEVLLSTLR